MSSSRQDYPSNPVTQRIHFAVIFTREMPITRFCRFIRARLSFVVKSALADEISYLETRHRVPRRLARRRSISRRRVSIGHVRVYARECPALGLVQIAPFEYRYSKVRRSSAVYSLAPFEGDRGGLAATVANFQDNRMRAGNQVAPAKFRKLPTTSGLRDPNRARSRRCRLTRASSSKLYLYLHAKIYDAALDPPTAPDTTTGMELCRYNGTHFPNLHCAAGASTMTRSAVVHRPGYLLCFVQEQVNCC